MTWPMCNVQEVDVLALSYHLQLAQRVFSFGTSASRVESILSTQIHDGLQVYMFFNFRFILAVL
jgi:hypothetical protein